MSTTKGKTNTSSITTMTLSAAFIAELRHESSMTRKMLERVPMEQKDWRPDPKSMSLGRLATHIAEIPRWVPGIIDADEFDFATADFKSHVASGSEELMDIFQGKLDLAIERISAANDEELNKTWTVKRAGQTLMASPKKVALRGWVLSHFIHHRGQLSVYLRLLGVPVPGMYGPSADEKTQVKA